MDVFKNFENIHLCRSLFFNEIAGNQPVTLLKKIRPMYFPLKFPRFVKKFFFTENLRTAAPRWLVDRNSFLFTRSSVVLEYCQNAGEYVK